MQDTQEEGVNRVRPSLPEYAGRSIRRVNVSLRRVLARDRRPFRFMTAVAFTVVSAAYTLAVCAQRGGIDFSFDDSWIHVQYARTIFEGRPWQYAVGIPSTGSSSPLWSVILSPIFIFGYGHDTIVASVLTIASMMFAVDTFLVGELLTQHTKKWQISIAGQAVFVLVPRNAGLMLSGMEAPLSLMVMLTALILLPRPDKKSDLILGVVAGLAYLSRPEFFLIALLCLPPRAVWMLYRDRSIGRVASLVAMFLIAGVVALPWVLYCLGTTGLPLADSYYSKLRWAVTDYDVMLWDGWWSYWLSSDIFLTYGLLGSMMMLLGKRPFEPILVWGLTIVYRFTMPGMSLLFDARYLVPLFDLISICFVIGVYTFVSGALDVIGTGGTLKPLLGTKSVLVILVLLLLLVPTIGSYQLHTDIHAKQAKNIREMQWYLSEWVRDNVPENAVIASYDVGALGFLSRATLIDVYGLVTPEILHNRTTTYEVAAYLRELNCSYVMFYVEWFPWLRGSMESLDAELTLLITATIEENVVCGTSNMAIWQVTWT